MKAFCKITGEIIEVEFHSSIEEYDHETDTYIKTVFYKDIHNEKTYDMSLLDFSIKEIDWEQRRFELAKTALNGMLAHSRNGHGYHPRDPKMHWHDAIAEEAIEIADAVIAKLKEE